MKTAVSCPNILWKHLALLMLVVLLGGARGQSDAPTAELSNESDGLIDATILPSDAPTDQDSAATNDTLSPTIPDDTTTDAATDPPVDPCAELGGIDETQNCYFNLTRLDCDVSNSNPFFQRRYVLCPNTQFEIGIRNEEGGVDSGHEQIELRQNTEYLCGEDGKSSNNCVLFGGEQQILGLALSFGFEPLVNIKLRGLTFEKCLDFSAVLISEGDIEFHDCVWRDQGGRGVISLVLTDFFARRNLRVEEILEMPRYMRTKMLLDEHKRFLHELEVEEEGKLEKIETKRDLQGPTRLKVSFFGCEWMDNQIAVGAGPGTSSGVIDVATTGHDVIIEGCRFTGNNYDNEKQSDRGYALNMEVEGNTLVIRDTCFYDNDFDGLGTVLLNSVGELLNHSNIFAEEQEDVKCAFAHITSTDSCIESDLDSCPLSRDTPSPTAATSKGNASSGSPSTKIPSTESPSAGSQSTGSLSAGSPGSSADLISCLTAVSVVLMSMFMLYQ